MKTKHTKRAAFELYQEFDTTFVRFHEGWNVVQLGRDFGDGVHTTMNLPLKQLKGITAALAQICKEAIP